MRIEVAAKEYHVDIKARKITVRIITVLKTMHDILSKKLLNDSFKNVTLNFASHRNTQGVYAPFLS